MQKFAIKLKDLGKPKDEKLCTIKNVIIGSDSCLDCTHSISYDKDRNLVTCSLGIKK